MDPDIPDEYKEIYQSSWSVIRERVKVGQVKDTYNFPLFTLLDSEISQKVERVLGQYNQSIKLNIAFGFILKHITTEVMKFFYPSNNTLLFETISHYFSWIMIDVVAPDHFYGHFVIKITYKNWN